MESERTSTDVSSVELSRRARTLIDVSSIELSLGERENIDYIDRCLELELSREEREDIDGCFELNYSYSLFLNLECE